MLVLRRSCLDTRGVQTTVLLCWPITRGWETGRQGQAIGVERCDEKWPVGEGREEQEEKSKEGQVLHPAPLWSICASRLTCNMEQIYRRPVFCFRRLGFDCRDCVSLFLLSCLSSAGAVSTPSCLENIPRRSIFFFWSEGWAGRWQRRQSRWGVRERAKRRETAAKHACAGKSGPSIGRCTQVGRRVACCCCCCCCGQDLLSPLAIIRAHGVLCND